MIGPSVAGTVVDAPHLRFYPDPLQALSPFFRADPGISSDSTLYARLDLIPIPISIPN